MPSTSLTKTQTTKDKLGDNILIEWHSLDPRSPAFANIFKEFSPILVQAYVPVEKDFATAYPQALSQDMFLKSLEPLFLSSNHKVDIQQVKEMIGVVLSQFFTEGIVKSMSSNSEVCDGHDHLIIIAREPGGEPLGLIYYMISKSNSQENVRVPVLAVEPKAQNRGIGKVLVRALFNKYPQVKKVLLSTRLNNETAINAYNKWGFTQIPSKMEYWVNMEYDTNKSSLLQKV